MNPRWLLIAIAAAPLLSGCGGSRTAGVPARGGGSIAVTVKWPDRDRLVPLAANSIKVAVTLSGQELAAATLVRPAGGGFSTTRIDNLRVAELTVTATAYPSDDATGVAQAQGAATIQTVDGQAVPLTLTMSTTIATLEVSPANPTVAVGSTLQLAITARDAAGNVVLTDPARMTWQSSAPAVATVSADGLVTGVSVGSSTITVTETESGRSADVSLEVVSAPAPTGNLLVNGDFSAGNTGFSTQYIYKATLLNVEGAYTVGSNPRNHHYRQVGNFGDHTTGTGLMFLANAAGVPGVTAWEETVNVAPGTNYSLTGWTAAWGGAGTQPATDPSPTRLRILINGVEVATHSVAAQNGTWTQFSVVWSSGVSAQATITLVDTNTVLDGNDFALDDLYFGS